MALPSAQDVAAKWASRAGAASTDYVQGAERTDKDPTALAINALPRAKQQYIAANYATGVSQAEGKVAAAFAPLLAYIGGGLSRVASMPANTDAERKARMNFWFDYMSSYQRPS